MSVHQHVIYNQLTTLINMIYLYTPLLYKLLTTDLFHCG